MVVIVIRQHCSWPDWDGQDDMPRLIVCYSTCTVITLLGFAVVLNLTQRLGSSQLNVHAHV